MHFASHIWITNRLKISFHSRAQFESQKRTKIRRKRCHHSTQLKFLFETINQAHLCRTLTKSQATWLLEVSKKFLLELFFTTVEKQKTNFFTLNFASCFCSLNNIFLFLRDHRYKPKKTSFLKFVISK